MSQPNNPLPSRFRWKLWVPIILVIIIAGVAIAIISTRKNEPTYANINSPRPVTGNPNAKVTLVEYSDFQCPACSAVQPYLQTILTKYGNDIRFEYKQYPLKNLHANAYNAALASECANDQGKFWPYHDKLFQNQNVLGVSDLKKYAQDLGLDTTKFNACLDSKAKKSVVDADIADGNAKKLGGTPSFFLNGNYLQLTTFTDLETAVKSAISGVQQGPVK
jgi:protein-disulfide isomerase